jgi:hypothetical protein
LIFNWLRKKCRKRKKLFLRFEKMANWTEPLELSGLIRGRHEAHWSGTMSIIF